MPSQGRPPKVGVRHKNENVYLRFKGDEWAIGKRDEWTDARIDEERQRILALNQLGQWTGPPPKTPMNTGEPRHRRGPRFEIAADDFYRRQNNRNLDEATLVDLAARIRHLKSFFGEAGNDYRMHDLTVATVEAYQDFKRRETGYITELRQRYRAGDQTLSAEQVEIARHPTRTGLSAAGINRTVVTLGRIVERYQSQPGGMAAMPVNPARVKGVKLNVAVKRSRSYLEPDQVQAMFDAAIEMEAEARRDRQMLGRYETLAVLVCCGLRISEMCSLQRRDVNLEASKLFVADSKTETGIREVWLSPFIVGVLRHWMQVRQTKFTAPDAPLFPNSKGNFRDVNRYRDRIMGNAVARGEELLAERGLSPMPREVTPHSLRRTYVTYAGEAGWSQAFVMNQVGHADQEMTTNVYTQLMRDRDDPRIWEWIGDPVIRREARAASRQRAATQRQTKRPALALVEPLPDAAGAAHA